MVPLLPSGTEVIAGLELGGIPLPTMSAHSLGYRHASSGSRAKTYGTRRLAEGGEVTDRAVTLIEDVITTGGAVRNATVALRAQGATVDVVVCAINRGAADQLLGDAAIKVRPRTHPPRFRRRPASSRSPVARSACGTLPAAAGPTSFSTRENRLAQDLSLVQFRAGVLSAPHMVMTTFPCAFPSPRYRTASAT